MHLQVDICVSVNMSFYALLNHGCNYTLYPETNKKPLNSHANLSLIIINKSRPTMSKHAKHAMHCIFQHNRLFVNSEKLTTWRLLIPKIQLNLQLNL